MDAERGSSSIEKTGEALLTQLEQLAKSCQEELGGITPEGQASFQKVHDTLQKIRALAQAAKVLPG